jgi:hypothetical protein
VQRSRAVRAALLPLVWLILAAPAGAATPLERHSPVIVHASGEPSPLGRVAGPGSIQSGNPTVYGRADGAWLQYWLAYPDNPQDRGIVRTGRHEGDWELVQVHLGAGARPDSIVVAQHSGAERCGWAVVERAGARPVIYVARGSHASYLRAGVRDRTWPDPNDEADGRGTRVRPRLTTIDEGSPSWMRFADRWGGAPASSIPGESDSPRGPAFQGVRWDDPDAFATSARSCRAERCRALGACDGRETLVGGALLVLGALAIGGVARRRRRPSNEAPGPAPGAR